MVIKRSKSPGKAFDLMLVRVAIRALRGSPPSPIFLLYSGHLEVVEGEGGVSWKKPLCCWLRGIKYALGLERHRVSLKENPSSRQLASFVIFPFLHVCAYTCMYECLDVCMCVDVEA